MVVVMSSGDPERGPLSTINFGIMTTLTMFSY